MIWLCFRGEKIRTEMNVLFSYCIMHVLFNMIRTSRVPYQIDVIAGKKRKISTGFYFMELHLNKILCFEQLVVGKTFELLRHWQVVFSEAFSRWGVPENASGANERLDSQGVHSRIGAELLGVKEYIMDIEFVFIVLEVLLYKSYFKLV